MGDQSIQIDMDDPLDSTIKKDSRNRVQIQRQHTPLQDPWGSQFAPNIPTMSLSGTNSTDVSVSSKQGEESNIVASTNSTKSHKSSDSAPEPNDTTGAEPGMDTSRPQLDANRRSLVVPHIKDDRSNQDMDNLIDEYQCAILRLKTESKLIQMQTNLKQEQVSVDTLDSCLSAIASPQQMTACSSVATWASASDLPPTRNISST